MTEGICVADAGPLRYLALLGYFDLLPSLFERIVIPETVAAELTQPKSPDAIKSRIQNPPSWIQIVPNPAQTFTSDLDLGESEAIHLAVELNSSILLDDQDARAEARKRGLIVVGTIGILEMLAAQHAIDLASAFENLRHTNFYVSEEVLAEALKRDQGR